MRLIDADRFKRFLQALCKAGAPYEGVIQLLDKEATAYDVEKVMAELEEAKEKITKEDYCRTKHYIENDCEHKDCFKCCAEYLIDIVKRGGVE